MSIDKKKIVASLLLLLVTVIWGTGFAVSQMALDANVSPGLLILFRFLFGSFIMLIVFYRKIIKSTKLEWKNGSIAGVILFLSFLAQTIGLQYTTPTNNALITSLNILFVPFFSWIILKHRPNSKTLLLLIMSFGGVFFLTYSFDTGFVFNIGDLLTLVCAILYALHIAYLSLGTKGCRTENLAFIQIFVVAILSIVYVLSVETNAIYMVDYSKGLLPVIYLGVFSTSVAFFIQTYAQKYLHPSRTALILACEGVFGTIFSVMLGYDPITLGMVVGGLLVFTSVLLSVKE